MRDGLELVILHRLHQHGGAFTMVNQNQVVALLENHRSCLRQGGCQRLLILHSKFTVERVEKRILGAFPLRALGVERAYAQPGKAATKIRRQPDFLKPCINVLLESIKPFRQV